MKKGLLILLLGFSGGILGSFLFFRLIVEDLQEKQTLVMHEPDQVSLIRPKDVSYLPNADPGEFISASSASTQSVVYIKTVISQEYESMSLLDWFFYGSPRHSQKVITSGSGVIYKKDGYIITNNHVIEQAQEIQVVIGKRTLAATLVGTDPSTDIAVIKVDEKDLPAIDIGSSKNLKVGEWVLAIGNPFNLTSTVTAGIVSAKGRNLSSLSSNFPIVFFIQTDAAINPGNSGGALVNASGQLVGINTAILSPSGAFSGYGFAVPVDIAKKVADDIISYGRVQKAYLGIDVMDIDDKVAKTLELESYEGVIVSDVFENMAAEKSGLEAGDVILGVGGNNIDSKAEYDEQLAYYRPGDKISVLVKREKEKFEVNTTLTNFNGTTEIVIKELIQSEKLGVVFEKVSPTELSQLRISSGFRVENIDDGLIKELGIDEGFIITSINGYKIQKVDDIERILTRARGRVRVEGLNKNGVKGYYSYYF